MTNDIDNNNNDNINNNTSRGCGGLRRCLGLLLAQSLATICYHVIVVYVFICYVYLFEEPGNYDVDARVHGCMDAWMYGCVGVWVCGCMGVWM